MFDWNDARYFLAAARTGSSAHAAALLNVNQSTVSRRIVAMETALNTALFNRTARGLTLREEAETALSLAEDMERAALEMVRRLDSRRNRLEGVVRLTMVEEVAAMWIAPALPEFRRRWPGVRLELLTGNRTFDLARGEADVSLRMMRPREGALFARKIGEYGFAIYGSKAYLEGVDPERLHQWDTLDWVVTDDGSLKLPEPGWLQRSAKKISPVLKCNSLKTLMAAVSAGLGVAMAPKAVARQHPNLERLPIDTRDVRGELWLAVPEELRGQARIQAVLDFLVEAANRSPH